MRPVVVDGRVLIDGGAANPLPFDQLRGRADSWSRSMPGGRRGGARHNPECIATTVLVMGSAMPPKSSSAARPIIRQGRRLPRARFLQAGAILRASEPAKAELKEKLAALLGK